MTQPSQILGEIIGKILAGESRIEINDKDISDTGDITFTINLKAYGVTSTALAIVRNEFNSKYCRNLIGMWFVRQNLDELSKLMAHPYVTPALDKFVHRSFGISLPSKLTASFSFHCSLIKILLEEKRLEVAKEESSRRSPPAPKPAPKPDVTAREFTRWIEEIPLLKPREMFDVLGQQGYIGQDAARRAICLMAYRHVIRLRRIHLDHVPRAQLPTKDNMLFAGPTGSGKTFLVETVFSHILKIPSVVVDITSYTEAGYIGDDVTSILTRLVRIAGNDMIKASSGIICIDEFDKLAGNTGARGGPANKDVSGFGVQRELLKMLESADITIPEDPGKGGNRGAKVTMQTADVAFIACGAFSGLKRTVSAVETPGSMGFGSPARSVDLDRSGLTRREVTNLEGFASYGIMPELIGRFSRIVPFAGLGKPELREILKRNTMVQYSRELELAGVKLEIEENVYDAAVETCIQRGTGARGLRNLINESLEQACFDIYSSSASNKVIRMAVRAGEIETDIAA